MSKLQQAHDRLQAAIDVCNTTPRRMETAMVVFDCRLEYRKQLTLRRRAVRYWLKWLGFAVVVGCYLTTRGLAS